MKEQEQSQLLTLQVLQFAPTSETDRVLETLNLTETGYYTYYSQLIGNLVVRYGKTREYWRSKVSQLWPEGKLESRNAKCSKWVRLRASNGYIIFARREDYDNLIQEA